MYNKKIIKRAEIRPRDRVMAKVIVGNRPGLLNPHWHDYFEVVNFIFGEGMMLLDSSRFTMRAGDSALIPPGLVHDTCCSSPKGSYLRVIQFGTPGRAGESELLRQFRVSRGEDSVVRVVRAADKRSAPVSFLCGAILEETAALSRSSDMIIGGAVDMLFGYFEHEAPAATSDADRDVRFDTAGVCAYIEANLTRPVTLSDAAAFAGYSPNYFSHKFREAVGGSFKDYVDFARMREARRMLIDRKLNVSEISAALGYDNVQNFCRAFKRVNHMTPLESVSKRM